MSDLLGGLAVTAVRFYLYALLGAYWLRKQQGSGSAGEGALPAAAKFFLGTLELILLRPLLPFDLLFLFPALFVMNLLLLDWIEWGIVEQFALGHPKEHAPRVLVARILVGSSRWTLAWRFAAVGVSAACDYALIVGVGGALRGLR